MMAVCGVCLISISDVILLSLICIKPKKKIIYTQNRRIERKKGVGDGELELK